MFENNLDIPFLRKMLCYFEEYISGKLWKICIKKGKKVYTTYIGDQGSANSVKG